MTPHQRILVPNWDSDSGDWHGGCRDTIEVVAADNHSHRFDLYGGRSDSLSLCQEMKGNHL